MDVVISEAEAVEILEVVVENVAVVEEATLGKSPAQFNTVDTIMT